MLKIGGGLDLSEKPVGTNDRSKLGSQDLQGDVPVVSEVASQVDRGRASGADLTLDGVTISEGGDQAVGNLIHPLLTDASPLLQLFIEGQHDHEVSRIGRIDIADHQEPAVAW